MQTLTEAIWKLNPPGGLFDETVVATSFPEETPAARRNLVYRAAQHGEAAILRRGLYILKEPFCRAILDSSVLAPLIYGPSYLSFESALRFHGLIPDIVQSTGAATSRRSRKFETPLGIFTFTSVPVRTLMAGVRSIAFEVEGHRITGLVASPVRAIADLVYLRREILWETDGMAFLTDSMRIDIDEFFASFRSDEIEATQETYRNSRVRTFIGGLKLLTIPTPVRKSGKKEQSP